jgi:hypothetical protein
MSIQRGSQHQQWFFHLFLRLGTSLLTVATYCAGGLLSNKCYSVRPNFLEEAPVSNLVVFIGMSAMEQCHIV